MKFKEALVIGTALISLFSCNDKKGNSSTKILSKETDTPIQEIKEGLPIELLGNYHGIQPSYFIKNQYGDDMTVNGNKVSVPSIDYKFLIKEDNIISLQQINLEDNNRVYYDGTYKIISKENDITMIECSLSDGQTSNPSYTISINKRNKKGICSSSNEPEFSIEKIK